MGIEVQLLEQARRALSDAATLAEDPNVDVFVELRAQKTLPLL